MIEQFVIVGLLRELYIAPPLLSAVLPLNAPLVISGSLELL